jgi:hypothetical protein
MSRQFRIKRRVAQSVVTENGALLVDLPRGYDIESIMFRLAGSIVVATGATSVRAESPAGLVKRLELIADGKNTICSVPFVMLSRGNVFRNGQLGSLTPPTAATAATYVVGATCVLDQQLVDGIRPKDSNLRTSGMSLLQLRFTFGNALDAFVPGSGVASLSGMTIDVITTELVELQDEKGQVTSPLFLLKRSYQDIAFTTSNANMEVPLPVGNVMRGVVLRGEGAVTAGEPSDAVLNNVILRSGVDVRLNVPYTSLREQNKADYGITTLPTGFCVADLMTSGSSAGARASEGWDLTRASEAKLVLDVTGAAATKITAQTMELVR